MTKECNRNQVIGQITTGIDQNTLAFKTIHFVRAQLPIWRDDLERPYEQSENKLNLQLCKFLDSCARNDFPMVRFDHEEYQSDCRSVDLAASSVETTVIGARQHTIYDPVLVIECKRLPAPSYDCEKEYVTGGKEHKSGGIQRFKLGLHGGDLDIVAMIGYVQERSTREWQHDINKWISELASGTIADVCVWNACETLELLDECVSKGTASYQSVHSRTGHKSGNEIRIHHLWIAMNTEQTQKDHD
ncbi:MAG: hypothetical protein IIB56_18490 [Planctomycetes bacterium]|nr:hypothetical protein [Planctomycetota bacterium]